MNYFISFLFGWLFGMSIIIGYRYLSGDCGIDHEKYNNGTKRGITVVDMGDGVTCYKNSNTSLYCLRGDL